MSEQAPNHMLEQAIAERLCCSRSELRSMVSMDGT